MTWLKELPALISTLFGVVFIAVFGLVGTGQLLGRGIAPLRPD